MRWPSTPSPEIPLQRFFFFFGLSEQVQRRKEMGGKANDNGFFLFPSWGGEGYPVGRLCIATQTVKTPLEAQSQVLFFFLLDIRWGLTPEEAPEEAPENFVSSREKKFFEKEKKSIP